MRDEPKFGLRCLWCTLIRYNKGCWFILTAGWWRWSWKSFEGWHALQSLHCFVRCTLDSLTGHIEMETSELQDQPRAFRTQMLILRRNLEDFGKQIKLQVERSTGERCLSNGLVFSKFVSCCWIPAASTWIFLSRLIFSSGCYHHGMNFAPLDLFWTPMLQIWSFFKRTVREPHSLLDPDLFLAIFSITMELIS